MPAPFNDANLQTYNLTDFTPGIHRWNRPNVPVNYPYSAPPGSAAHAFRCWAKKEVGLIPLPSYRIAQTFSATDPSNIACVSLGNMLSLTPRGGAFADIVSAILVQNGPGLSQTFFYVTRLPVNFITFTPTTVYSSANLTWPQNTTTWPMMDFAYFQDPSTSAWSRCIITTDPISTSFTTGNPGIWVTVPGWTIPTATTRPESSNGTFPLVGLIGSYPRIFFHSPRACMWQIGASQTVTNNFVSSDADELYTAGTASPNFQPTPWQFSGVFYPDMGTTVSAWGSWSTGELLGIYAEGGGFIAYGDPFAANPTYKLPGVMGTAGATGPAALTPIGAIYPRQFEGVYLWNGDNNSQPISQQIPDGVFTRTVQTNGFENSPLTNTSQAAWGDWVFFPNNWMLDTVTQSWWLNEDPNVINFQVNAPVTGPGFLTAPGPQYSAGAGASVSLNTYYWDKRSAVSSYFWQSNPIPVTVGSLVTLALVEIVASNMTPTPATITIQPISPQQPVASTPFQNQNGSSVTFTIPAMTANYRAQQRMGYADYNIQLAVTATNTTPNAAPTLHAINCSYTQTRTSGV